MPIATPSWNTVRVHAKWVNQDGSMKPGSWKLTMPVRVTNKTDDVIIPIGVIGSGPLNITPGLPSLDIQAPCHDDPDNSPQNVQPVLEITFLDAPGERYVLDTPLALSNDVNGIDLADVVLADSLPIPVEFLLKGVPGGIAELDSEGFVLDAAGVRVTGAVTSVAGKVGIVTLVKSDVGLANVDNTADTAKPVSTAQATAIGAKADTSALTAHTGNTANPHATTKAQVGLGNVDNTSDASKPVSTAQAAAFVPTIGPEKFLTPTGNPTADASAINAAIFALDLLGGGRVRLSGDAWNISNAITPRSNITLSGSPGTTLTGSVLNLIYAKATAFTNFTLEGITFLGMVNEFPTSPKRGRTTSGAGAQCAVYMTGDLDTSDTGQAALTNFTMRNCTVQNMAILPLRIGGVRGKVSVTNCEFINNQDVGFLFCEEVIFNNNHVYGSADNGVSLSRGCKKVTCVGNVIENCAYNGIWVSGFFSDKAPEDFTVSGNVVRNVGHNGIIGDYAPKNGVIVGNSIDGGFFRGPSDEPGDSNGSGIFLGGFPIASRGAPTDWATNITVQGNTIRNMPRAGIYVAAGKVVAIHGNVITDIGTQFLANGTTAITSADATQNIGVYIDFSTVNTHISVQGNLVVDTRATPYTNWMQQPVTPGATWMYSLNQMSGLRNATFNLVEGYTSATREVTTPMRFDANTKAVGGVTTGAGSSTGDVVGFDANGAAGSRRGFKVLAGGITRWWLRGNGTAETGGGTNSGSDLELAAYADDGTTSLGIVLAATRSTAAVTLGSGFTVPVTIKGRRVASAGAATIAAGATSTTASATGGGANDSSGYVGATISGTPTAATVATVTYSTAYSAVPKVVITPRNAASAACQLYVTSETATGFAVAAGVAPGSGASISFGYHVEG